MDAFQQIDQDFLLRFPGGLNDPEWLALAKKYRVVDKVRELAASLDAATLAQALDSGCTTAVVDTLDKLISRCPTVSTFERMAFRHYLAYSDTHLPLIAALDGVWRRCEAETFEQWVSVLEMCRHDKCANPAKWPVVTAFLAYADPDAHVHIKPTTTRQLAARLGVDIGYQSRPNFATYQRVREMVSAFRASSAVAHGQNYITTQAVMYCAL